MAPKMCVTVLLGFLATLQMSYVMSQSAQCRQQLDICVALDTSDFNLESAIGLGRIKSALKNYLAMYDIGTGSNKDQVGICLYGTDTSTPVVLGEDQDIALIEQKIGAVNNQNTVTGFSVRGGFVNADLGLQCCRDMLTTRGRFNKRELTVLVALANSDNRQQTALAAEELKKTGHLSVVTVGTSFSDFGEYQSYVSDASSYSVFNEYSSLVIDSTRNPQIAFGSWCPSLMVNPCDGCRWENGIGYALGPECWEYYQCEVLGEEVIPRLLKTAYGTFWNNTLLTLKEPSIEWTCPRDRCQSMATGAQYGRPDNCRIYMQCGSDNANHFMTNHIGCCAEGTRFLQGLGCVLDSSCNDNCTLSEPKIQNEKKPCTLLPVEGSPNQYSTDGMIMNCAPGTYYNYDLCTCAMGVAVPSVCEPDLDLHMDQFGVHDNSRNKYPLMNEGVFTRFLGNGQYSAMFQNSSSLRILGFSNKDLRDKFTIHMKIRPSADVHFLEAIVSNSDCELGRETYAVLLDNVSRLRTINGFAHIDSLGRTETAPILLAKEGIIDIVYSYNGAALSVLVQDNLGKTTEVSPPAAGLIKLRQPSCAMTIGDSLAYNHYEGEILEFKVFMGCTRGRLEDYML